MSAVVALPGRPVELLAAAVDSLAAQRVTAVGLGDELRDLLRQVRRLEAQVSRRVAAFDAAGAGAVDGAVSTKAWLQAHARMAPAEAVKQVQAARCARDLPATGAAYEAGDLSREHVVAIGKAMETIPDQARQWADRLLADTGRRVRPDDLRRTGLRIREYVDPDAGLQAANRAYERRELVVAPVGDEVFIRGVLDAEGGATVIAALDALMTPPGPGDGRSAGQRRADALVDLSRRALDGDTLPTVAGQRPHLVVTIDYDTLTGQVPADGDGGESPAVDGRLADRLAGIAALDHVGPVPAATARRLACDAGIIPAVLGADSAVLDLGQHTRVVSTALRRALALRDGGCRFPGCGVPPQWTDAHHLVPWHQGGPTDLGSLVLLCRRHHRLVHEGGWSLVGAPDREIHAVRPDGSRLRLASVRRPAVKVGAGP